MREHVVEELLVSDIRGARELVVVPAVAHTPQVGRCAEAWPGALVDTALLPRKVCGKRVEVDGGVSSSVSRLVSICTSAPNSKAKGTVYRTALLRVFLAAPSASVFVLLY